MFEAQEWQNSVKVYFFFPAITNLKQRSSQRTYLFLLIMYYCDV